MIKRREVLKFGIAAMAAPAIVRAAISPLNAAADMQIRSLSYYKVIFDHRFRDSRLFADEAKSLGANVHGIKGDVTDLWYHDLYFRWRKGPAAIAGMTTADSLFCLEQLARDQRMRVVFRADHQSLSNGRVEHLLSGRTSFLQQEIKLDNRNWNKQIARLVMNFSSDQTLPSHTTALTHLTQATTEQEPLVSWVIAPIKKA